MRLAVRVDVLAGRFASQRLAFAHLLDAAGAAGLSPDFDHVEVIAPPHGPRLRGYFDEATAARIADEAGADTVILVLPGALITGAFREDARLRRLGRFDGTMVRA
ncbi:hypothetical protein [Jannaschia sp. W003]|uniref:hypothetical protein n=1 Tax=Jannaschia sp. W003 TaxID=2867012 RepID=UPI0021A25EBE|nr:hypothetical protein [Jannaschia sp. W003]UWQ22797.1 hypothetical protein K3554_07180 [Jannaschia sp. W003]